MTLLLVVLVSIAVSAGQSVAQSDDAATCEMAPLELPLFGGTPIAELATPGPDAATAGTGLDEAEAEAILQQYVACTNTGDPTLVWAMFSPRWFSTTFADPEEHYLPAFEWNLDNPVQTAEHPLELVGVEGIEVLDDGRVDVTASFRSGDEAWTDTLTLVEIDGQWLIDDVRLDTGTD